MDDLTSIQWQQLHDLIDKAATRVARQWPHVVDAHDVAQDMWLALLEAPGMLGRVFEEDERARQGFLVRLGNQAASRQQEAYDRFSGNYLYSGMEVRRLLEAGALESEPGAFDAAAMDLQEALTLLWDERSAYAEMITDRYSEGGNVPPRHSAERKQLNRAVDTLTARMNRLAREKAKRRDGGPGSRTTAGRTARAALARAVG